MAVSLKHTTQAAGTDAGNGEIRKAQWNEEHTLTLATARLLGRTTAGAGAAEEISAGTGLTLSSGVLSVTSSTYAALTHTHTISDVTGLQAALDLKAPLASPTFTGTPAAPTGAAYLNTTQIATTAQVYSTVSSVPETAQTGTSYTLVLGDAGNIVTLSNAAAITLTIPTNASVAFPVGTRIDLAQFGAGQVTIGGAGVTIRSSGSKLKLSGQYSGATLWKKATNEWLLVGDLVA